MARYALRTLPERFSLMGHSMGALVALEIWRLEPERVERLALSDTGVHPLQPGEADKRRRLSALGQNDGIEALVDAWLLPMIGPAHRDEGPILETLRAMVTDAGVPTFSRQTEALIHRPEAETLLSSIDCPVFAIVGRDDAWSPVAQHHRFMSQVGGGHVRVIDHAGHMAPIEEPAAFNAALGESLAAS